MGELGRFQTNIVEASGTVCQGHILEALASQPGASFNKGRKTVDFWFLRKIYRLHKEEAGFVWEILSVFYRKAEYVEIKLYNYAIFQFNPAGCTALFYKDAARPAATGQSNYKRGEFVMRQYLAGKIRNVALARPRWGGRDFFGGSPSVLKRELLTEWSRVEDGTTVCDFDAEETKRKGVGIPSAGPFCLGQHQDQPVGHPQPVRLCGWVL